MTNSSQYINWDIINSLADDDESLQMILKTFIESFDGDLLKLQEAKKSKNKEQLIFIVHTIKGASSNFCNDKIVKEIKDIENYIKIAESDNTQVFINKLENIVNSIIDELKSSIK